VGDYEDIEKQHLFDQRRILVDAILQGLRLTFACSTQAQQ
jgi:hypothetical protein